MVNLKQRYEYDGEVFEVIKVYPAGDKTAVRLTNGIERVIAVTPEWLKIHAKQK